MSQSERDVFSMTSEELDAEFARMDREDPDGLLVMAYLGDEMDAREREAFLDRLAAEPALAEQVVAAAMIQTALAEPSLRLATALHERAPQLADSPPTAENGGWRAHLARALSAFTVLAIAVIAAYRVGWTARSADLDARVLWRGAVLADSTMERDSVVEVPGTLRAEVSPGSIFLYQLPRSLPFRIGAPEAEFAFLIGSGRIEVLESAPSDIQIGTPESIATMRVGAMIIRRDTTGTVFSVTKGFADVRPTLGGLSRRVEERTAIHVDHQGRMTDAPPIAERWDVPIRVESTTAGGGR